MPQLARFRDLGNRCFVWHFPWYFRLCQSLLAYAVVGLIGAWALAWSGRIIGRSVADIFNHFPGLRAAGNLTIVTITALLAIGIFFLVNFRLPPAYLAYISVAALCAAVHAGLGWIQPVAFAFIAALPAAAMYGEGNYCPDRGPTEVNKLRLMRIEQALASFASIHGRLPASLDEVTCAPENMRGDCELTDKERINTWNKPFEYTLAEDGSHYILRSIGGDLSYSTAPERAKAAVIELRGDLAKPGGRK